MNLKEEIKTLDLHAQIGDLKGVDKENKIVEIFRNVAQQILSGYFLVQKNQSDSCVKVHPTCVEIYYHDKLLRHHSIGQRASALILFILMQSDNDIILIDQPEDDLDNKIIYDEVITAIAKKKQDIQFIFATHNANIPVLGDAERIFVVEYQDTTIDISQGNIDLKSTHKQIVDIMEGGEEAFDKRQLIYTSWK